MIVENLCQAPMGPIVVGCARCGAGNRVMSRTDKMTPIIARRYECNGFCAGSEGHGDFAELKSLEAKSLMRRTCRSYQFGGLSFYVTELGIELVRDVVGSLMECECVAEIVPNREPGCWNCAEGERGATS